MVLRRTGRIAIVMSQPQQEQYGLVVQGVGYLVLTSFLGRWRGQKRQNQRKRNEQTSGWYPLACLLKKKKRPDFVRRLPRRPAATSCRRYRLPWLPLSLFQQKWWRRQQQCPENNDISTHRHFYAINWPSYPELPLDNWHRGPSLANRPS